jgi:large conductance mechanosensitive channel
MSMLQEWKDFAMRGSVVDLAVGVIIGAAFGAIVTSLVNDIVMPPVGWVVGGAAFADLFWNPEGTVYPSLDAARAAGAPIIAYGRFINTLISFAIISWIIFLVVKQMNRLKKPAPAEPATKECPYCATSIPAKAVKCGSCTSDLTSGAKAIV